MSQDSNYKTPVDSSMMSEIGIGELRNYEYALKLNREEYGAVRVLEFDSDYTRNYLFDIHYTDERPNWQLITRDAALCAYDIINRGGEFKRLDFPGLYIIRDLDKLKTLH